MNSLLRVAKLLQVSEEDLKTALTERVIAARGEVMQKTHTLSEAEYGRDALAKVNILKFSFLCLSQGLQEINLFWLKECLGGVE